MDTKRLKGLESFNDEELNEIIKEIDIDFQYDLDDVTQKRIMKRTFEKLDIKTEETNKFINPKRRGLIAVSIGLVIVLALSQTGNRVIAMVKDTLVLIPGIGAQKSSMEEEKVNYVLKQPISWQNGKESIIVKGITMANSNLEIIFTGRSEKYFTQEYFSNTDKEEINKDQVNILYVKDRNGNIYKTQNYSMGDDGEDGSFHGKFTIGTKGESLKEFDLFTNDSLIAHVTLEKADEINGYEDIENKSLNEGVLLGATKTVVGDKINISLVSPNFGEEVKEKRIGGLGFDDKLNVRTDKITDCEGKEVAIEYGSSYSAPNDISFKNTGKYPYTLTIPNLGVDYLIDETITVPVTDKEQEINKDIKLGKFNGKLIKTIKSRENNVEILSVYIKLSGGSEKEIPNSLAVNPSTLPYKGASIDVLSDNIIVFHIKIKGNEKNLNINLQRVGSRLVGPWSIKIDK